MRILPSCSSPVFAGSTNTRFDCSDNFTQEEIISFAKKVEKTLLYNAARVAIVGRVGRSPNHLPRGINFTHVAYWVYSRIKTADNNNVSGYKIYNLYQRREELNVSELVNDFPIDYFSGVHELKAGIVIPKPKVQKGVLDVISSGAHRKLHNPKYSLVASPFTNLYQNCTGYVLDVLMSALCGTDNMDQLKANAKAYFTPQTVHLSPLNILLGRIFFEDFTTLDHKGAIETATFTTLSKFMHKYDLALKTVLVEQ